MALPSTVSYFIMRVLTKALFVNRIELNHCLLIDLDHDIIGFISCAVFTLLQISLEA